MHTTIVYRVTWITYVGAYGNPRNHAQEFSTITDAIAHRDAMRAKHGEHSHARAVRVTTEEI